MTHIASMHVDVVVTRLHTPFVTAQRRTEVNETVVLRLVDSDGRVGWGEGPQSWRVTGESLAGVRACLEGPLRQVLVGADLGEPERLLGAIQGAVVGNPSARMAADLAVHDLLARAAGVGVAEVLGHRPDGGDRAEVRLPTDVTLAAGDLEALADAARARVADGFETLKLKVGTDASTDVERVRAVREAVGPGIGLRVDANQGWSVPEAVGVITALAEADLGLEVVEQPVRRRDLAGLVEVARRVPLPVMADESVFDLDDLDDLARLNEAAGAPVAMVNVKLAKCGGLSPARRIVARAHELGMRVLVGSMMESFVGMAAGAALAQASGADGRGPDLVPDLDAAWWSQSSPFADGPRYERGKLVLPAGPGFGISALAG